MVVSTAITYNNLQIMPYYSNDGKLLAVQLYGTATSSAGGENFIKPISRMSEYQKIREYLHGKKTRIAGITLAPTVAVPTKWYIKAYYEGTAAGVEGYSETFTTATGEMVFAPIIDRTRVVNWDRFDAGSYHFLGFYPTALTLNDIIGYIIDLEVVE